ncbi:MAG TPA: hypothetical protein VJJ83_03415 [Candidatus Babeliales bacterium]|nr:hypothetical protein [Candidatus Babeliales bacterium]
MSNLSLNLNACDQCELLEGENQSLRSQIELYENAVGLHAMQVVELGHLNTLLAQANLEIAKLRGRGVTADPKKVSRRKLRDQGGLRRTTDTERKAQLMAAQTAFALENHKLALRVVELKTANSCLRARQARRCGALCDCPKAVVSGVAVEFTAGVLDAGIGKVLVARLLRDSAEVSHVARKRVQFNVPESIASIPELKLALTTDNVITDN